MKRRISKGFLGAMMVLSAVSGHAIEVALASTSAIKSKAVKEAFSQAFPGEEVVVRVASAPSGVPEQPMGLPAGWLGAEQRMTHMSQNLSEPVDYVIGMENFVAQDEQQRWYDQAAVVIQNRKDGTICKARSGRVFIPTKFVDRAMSRSHELTELGIDVTVGSVIAEAFDDRHLDPADWHKEPEFGGVSRVDQLRDAIFKGLHRIEIEALRSCISYHSHFPKKGKIFLNCLPIFEDPERSQHCIRLLKKRFQKEQIDAIVGLEARGFIIGSMLAQEMGLPFVPVRKQGKLPGKTFSVAYQKSYGEDRFEIAKGALAGGKKVLMVDDLIATGGSALAGIELVRLAGGEVVAFASLLEILSLQGRAKLGVPSFNLIDLEEF